MKKNPPEMAGFFVSDDPHMKRDRLSGRERGKLRCGVENYAMLTLVVFGQFFELNTSNRLESALRCAPHLKTK